MTGSATYNAARTIATRTHRADRWAGLVGVAVVVDMETPPAHRERCLTASACGAWLERNGEAIYATHPWTPSAATTSNGQQVRFTQKDATVYAIVLGDQLADSLTVHGLRLPAGSRVGLLHGPADLA